MKHGNLAFFGQAKTAMAVQLSGGESCELAGGANPALIAPGRAPNFDVTHLTVSVAFLLMTLPARLLIVTVKIAPLSATCSGE